VFPVVLFISFLFPQILPGKIWNVDTLGSEGDSLQKYISIAHDSSLAYSRIDTVLLLGGTYHVNVNYFLDTAYGLIVPDSVVLLGSGGAPACTLDAVSEDLSDTALHVIFIDSVGYDTLECRILIKNIALIDGYARGLRGLHNCGGGILCLFSAPVIESCYFFNNRAGNGTAGHGGGIFAANYSRIRIKDCWFKRNSVKHNSSQNYGMGGAIGIYAYTDAEILNSKMENDSVVNSGQGGGAIGISYHCNVRISGCEIRGNYSYNGGGIYTESYTNLEVNNSRFYFNTSYNLGSAIYCQSPTTGAFTNNVIMNNYSQSNSTVYLYGVATGYNTFHLYGEKILYNTTADGPAGLYINATNVTIEKSIVYENRAGEDTYSEPGGILIGGYSNVGIRRSIIASNSAGNYGGISVHGYASLNMDSSMIVDNGGTEKTYGGTFFISSPDGSVSVYHSNLYYNTFQPDSEIYNGNSDTLLFTENFWWDTTYSEIEALFWGNGDFSNWLPSPPDNVPGEPYSVDSVLNFSDTLYNTVVSYLSNPDTLFLRIFGSGRCQDIQDVAVALLRSSIYPDGIAVALLESDTPSGIFQGFSHVEESTGDNDIRVDDIHQTIRVHPYGDTIFITTNVDTGKIFKVVYKNGLAPEITLSDSSHDYGSVVPGDTASWTLYIKNEGSYNLVVDSLVMDNPSFIVDTTAPLLISSGDSSGVEVLCIPSDTGNLSGILHIYSTDPDESISNVNLYAYATGIGEVQDNHYKIYADLSGNITFEFQGKRASSFSFVIYDAAGRVMGKREIITGAQGKRIKLFSGLKSGIYFLQINREQVKRLTVIK